MLGHDPRCATHFSAGTEPSTSRVPMTLVLWDRAVQDEISAIRRRSADADLSIDPEPTSARLPIAAQRC